MFLIMIIPTIVFVFWTILMLSATQEDLDELRYNKIVDNIQKIKELEIKYEKTMTNQELLSGISLKLNQIFNGNGESIQKQISKLERQIDNISDGNLRGVSIFDIPGYTFFRKFDFIKDIDFRKNLLAKCTEYYGHRHASYRVKQIFSRIINYSLFGFVLCIPLGVIFTEIINQTQGLMIMLIGPAFFILLGYSYSSSLDSKIKKRRSLITRQFPNVVSKLALLVTSGMIIDRAWQETSKSGSEGLYNEMRVVTEGLSNGLSYEIAFTEFIKKCNTKETAKLASSIIQGMSKGNAEIGELLKGMSKDAWAERKHNAKRDAETANGKLLIPIMVLFVDILIMIMLPVFMSL